MVEYNYISCSTILRMVETHDYEFFPHDLADTQLTSHPVDMMVHITKCTASCQTLNKYRLTDCVELHTFPVTLYGQTSPKKVEKSTRLQHARSLIYIYIVKCGRTWKWKCWRAVTSSGLARKSFVVCTLQQKQLCSVSLRTTSTSCSV